MDSSERKQFATILLERGAIPGFILIQNVTLPFGRHIVPKFLYINEKAYRPTMLVLSRVAGDSNHLDSASIVFDVIWDKPIIVTVIGSVHKRVSELPDGSAIYECLIENSDNLPLQQSIEHRNFNLKLYHHTSEQSYPQIMKSKHLRSSPWNYHGNTKMTDRHFVYFTDLASFTSSFELQKIAMTDGGYTLAMQYDMPGVPPEFLNVPVRSREQLSHKIVGYLAPWLIEPSPMLFHDSQVHGGGVARYWELCHPNIFRIPVKPNGICSLSDSKIIDASCVPNWIDSTNIIAGVAFEFGSLRNVFDENPLAQMPINTGNDLDKPCPFIRFLSA